MDLIEVNKDNRKAQRTAPGADYVPLHPLTRCWEVPRHHVTIEKIIGKGAFGQVAKGTAVVFSSLIICSNGAQQKPSHEVILSFFNRHRRSWIY